jgi:hypothetical protein
MKTKGIRKSKKKPVEEKPISSIYDIIRRPVSDKVHFEGLKDYELYLNNLNLVDLQNHAVTVGLKPGRDRDLLKNTLIKQFAKAKAAQFGMTDRATDDAKSDIILKLLARSR